MPKVLDRMLQYGEPEDGTNRQRLSCKLRGQGMTRGISRLKYHLAKIPGHDVLICTESTPEIMRMAHDAIYEKDRKKEVAVANRVGTASGGVTRTSRTIGTSRFVSGTQGSERDSTNVDSPSTRASPFLQFVPRTGDGVQPSIR